MLKPKIKTNSHAFIYERSETFHKHYCEPELFSSRVTFNHAHIWCFETSDHIANIYAVRPTY